MKIRLLTIALMAAIVGLGACGGGDDKSSECKILKFTVNGIDYDINGTSITHLYPKTAKDTWTGMPPWPIAPSIQISDKASISPAENVKQDFIENTVTYTVTAEDGTPQTYTVHATRE